MLAMAIADADRRSHEVIQLTPSRVSARSERRYVAEPTPDTVHLAPVERMLFQLAINDYSPAAEIVAEIDRGKAPRSYYRMPFLKVST